jgi:peroxiredoxin
MQRRELLLLLLLIALSYNFIGKIEAAPPPETLPHLKASDLTDINGQKHVLAGPRSAKLVVLVFLGTECPVSNSYAPALKRLDETYAPRGVQVIGVHCDPDVTAQVAKDHAGEYDLPFPLVLDHQQHLAQSCGAQIVPTAVVVAADGRLLYRGQIDNRYVASGVRRPQATNFDLQAALDAVLAGRQPNPAVTVPFGCPIPPLRRD